MKSLRTRLSLSRVARSLCDVVFVVLFVHCITAPPHLDSSPTRRSSDLPPRALRGRAHPSDVGVRRLPALHLRRLGEGHVLPATPQVERREAPHQNGEAGVRSSVTVAARMLASALT